MFRTRQIMIACFMLVASSGVSAEAAPAQTNDENPYQKQAEQTYSANPGSEPMPYKTYTCEQFSAEWNQNEDTALTKAFETIKGSMDWVADKAAYNMYLERSRTTANDALAATLAQHRKIIADTTEVISLMDSEMSNIGPSRLLFAACAKMEGGTINDIASSYYVSFMQRKDKLTETDANQ